VVKKSEKGNWREMDETGNKGREEETEVEQEWGVEQ
jgi:hypothetical protein